MKESVLLFYLKHDKLTIKSRVPILTMRDAVREEADRFTSERSLTWIQQMKPDNQEKRNMTATRRQRLAEARGWYPEQHFTNDSHIVKAYRKQFHVNKDCAMKELCLLGMLPAEKQKAYEKQLAAKARKRAARKSTAKETLLDQDENFFFIAGYTSGGAPYGVTWDEVDDE